jgi:hypothetical protein
MSKIKASKAKNRPPKLDAKAGTKFQSIIAKIDAKGRELNGGPCLTRAMRPLLRHVRLVLKEAEGGVRSPWGEVYLQLLQRLLSVKEYASVCDSKAIKGIFLSIWWVL